MNTKEASGIFNDGYNLYFIFFKQSSFENDSAITEGWSTKDETDNLKQIVSSDNKWKAQIFLPINAKSPIYFVDQKSKNRQKTQI